MPESDERTRDQEVEFWRTVAAEHRDAAVAAEAANALLREALRLACEDGWDDGQWAMRRYIEMAQASLSGSEPSPPK